MFDASNRQKRIKFPNLEKNTAQSSEDLLEKMNQNQCIKRWHDTSWFHAFGTDKSSQKGKIKCPVIFSINSRRDKNFSEFLSKVVSKKKLNSFRKGVSTMHPLNHLNNNGTSTTPKTVESPYCEWSDRKREVRNSLKMNLWMIPGVRTSTNSSLF